MKIIIYDGHPLMRDGLKRLITDRGDVVVTATSDADQLLAAACSGEADLLLIDPVTLPATVLDNLRQPGEREDYLRCLVYTASESATYLLRGASVALQGCLSKKYCAEALNEALDGLAKGKLVSLPLSSLQPDNSDRRRADKRLLNGLTRRELQILRQLGAGKSNKMIAEEMELSNKTISTYKRNIMHKMKTSNFSELIDFARRNGF